jgi:UDP-GlcNAc:undecaprenyl-phosphate GlcNAc-1-phosphate transferase
MNDGQRIGLMAALCAIGAALVLVPFFRSVAQRLGVVDRPDRRPGGRKTQKQPVPLLGGVAVTFSAVLAVVGMLLLHPLARDVSFAQYGQVMLAGTLIFVMGLADDVFKDRFGPLPKFICQLAAVLVLFGPNYMDVVEGNQQPKALLHLLAVTLWFLTVVNAVNFVDNMDGLCAGLAMISLLTGLFGLGTADARAALVAGALGGGLLGFLFYNFPKARIYLGDAGSHVAGFFLAILSLEFTAGFFGKDARFFGIDAFVPAMLLLGIPLFDILFSVVCRLKERRPLFHGDARHLSHRLVGAGLDRTSAVLLLWGVHLILVAAGVSALAEGPGGRFATFSVVLVFLGVLSAILVRVERRRTERLAREAERAVGGGAEPKAGHDAPGSNGSRATDDAEREPSSRRKN